MDREVGGGRHRRDPRRKMRLFIATPVELPFYTLLKQELQPVVEGKWVEGFNLHLTHLFIGEDYPDRWQIPIPVPEGEIEVGGLRVLGGKILYLEPRHRQIGAVNRFLVERFQLPTGRRFLPHITLCRIKQIPDPSLLTRKLKELSHLQTKVPFTLYLYSSQLTRRGPIYKKIWKYR